MTAIATTRPRTAPAHARPRAAAPMLLRVGAEAAVFSAGIHLWVAPEHLREWWLYGAFFFSVAAAQVALAWLLMHRATLLVMLAGIWGNILLVGIYVASRTVGLPLSPPHASGAHAFHHLAVAGGVGNGVPVYPGTTTATNIEAVGTLDLFALAAELALVMVLVGMLPAGARRVTTNLMLVGGAAVWVTGALLAFA